MNLSEYIEQVKDLTLELQAGVCPVWQCGGVLEHIELKDGNWQTPDLKCKNCGAYFKFIGSPNISEDKQPIEMTNENKLKIYKILNSLKTKLRIASDNELYQEWAKGERKITFTNWVIDEVKQNIKEEQ